MDKSKKTDMEAVGLEWERMTENQSFDENIVFPIISKSWNHSIIAGVDPFIIEGNRFLKKEETESYIKSCGMIDEEFKSILQKIAAE